ncbi:MAG: N-acetylmuramoyl-L-alanine amidase, partial [Bryobacteraceae bacterium]
MSPSTHVRRKGAITGAAILLCGVLHAQQSGLNAVTEVRFWSFGEATRIVVETTGEFEFRSERLENPDRLFFDLLDTTLRMEGRGERKVPVGDSLLKQIRVAQTQHGVTRVVFDLAAEVEHSASQLSNPSRLIVELRPTGPAMPALESSAPSEGSAVSAKPAKAELEPLDEAGPEADLEPSPRVAPAAREARIPKGTPTPARLSKDREHSLARVLGLKLGRVVLDAGHGGHDTGTIGRAGLMEKDLVLDVAKRLGVLIEKRMRSEVIYTRSDDTFIPLEARTQIANEHKADLFLSIHANSSPARDSSGVETYYLNFTT